MARVTKGTKAMDSSRATTRCLLVHEYAHTVVGRKPMLELKLVDSDPCFLVRARSGNYCASHVLLA